VDERLKILFLTNRIPFPIIDGQTRRTYHILKGLAQKHEVTLLSLYERIEEIAPKNIQHIESFCKDVDFLPAPSKAFSFAMTVRLFRSLVSKYPYTIWRHYSRPYLNKIHNKLETEQYDLVHCDILPLAYTVQKIKSPVCTITDHDVSYLKTFRMAKQARNPFQKMFLYIEAFKQKKLESRVFNNFDLSIAVSKVDKEHLKRLCPKGRFEVIENGVETNEFKPISRNNYNNIIGWFGGFGHLPNKEAVYYFLRDIYPLIKKSISDVEFHLIGGNVPQKLKKIAAFDSSLKIMGFVDDPKQYLQEAKVIVVPLLSGSGTRLKILEALALGKAIVTTSIGCEGIEAENNEHHLVADTPQEFARVTVEILRNDDLRNKLERNGRELAKRKYDWDIICNKLNRVYVELVSSVA
jgi:glycosyltransferase involved in cell wall biosynthesis